MKIVIGTLNKAKNKAVKEIMNKVLGESQYFSVKTSSNVREQPMSIEEGISGAMHRAQNAMDEILNPDYGVGLEGFVTEHLGKMFLGGAVAIFNSDYKYGIGISALVLVPSYIATRIRKGEELGTIIQEITKDKKNIIRNSLGANGIFTNSLYGRVQEFKDATKCALATFISTKFYFEEK